jgi:hypothetical protein
MNEHIRIGRRTFAGIAKKGLLHNPCGGEAKKKPASLRVLLAMPGWMQDYCMILFGAELIQKACVATCTIGYCGGTTDYYMILVGGANTKSLRRYAPLGFVV